MRKLLLAVLAPMACAAFFFGAAASAAAGTLDQQQTSTNTNVGLVTTQSGAQTFTPGITGGLDQADLHLSKTGTPPATVTVEIRSTSAGTPTATVLATGTISTSGIGASGAFFPVTFAPPATVTAGTVYALVAYTPGSFGDTIGWEDQSTGNPYPGGELWTSTDPLPPGANWGGSSGGDFAFKTYVATTPPSPPTSTTGQRAAALASCKKRARKHHWSHKRLKRCKRNANLLPI